MIPSLASTLTLGSDPGAAAETETEAERTTLALALAFALAPAPALAPALARSSGPQAVRDGHRPDPVH